ncbi:hypothetical protein H310_13545 [Aphanomyces invadans]|uniref:Apple domain-containing protein n=1 Tax=Aphanomyces invadans TaxID=157072 RepID=A0A024TDF0_9STRA|nr:hypothetical protein H310_13545 [Aphanomyces invadans]ETV92019.1 hypothetical protein H310_13545 [Aphanomyces invadans]|eukprot:XP_008879316.1 hypothetical protein H310_13545 [Aphanomyces invadans]
MEARAGSISAPTCSKVADNVDYYGNDIKSTSQASVDGCCADCKATPGCKLFVWTTSLGGTCWLKHTQGAASTLPGAKSGVLVPSPPGGCTPPEWNVDYLGGDVASTPRASSSLCCDDCRRTQACRFFTWTAYNGGTCWLKSTKAKTVQATGAVSGSVL